MCLALEFLVYRRNLTFFSFLMIFPISLSPFFLLSRLPSPLPPSLHPFFIFFLPFIFLSSSLPTAAKLPSSHPTRRFFPFRTHFILRLPSTLPSPILFPSSSHASSSPSQLPPPFALCFLFPFLLISLAFLSPLPRSISKPPFKANQGIMWCVHFARSPL